MDEDESVEILSLLLPIMAEREFSVTLKKLISEVAVVSEKTLETCIWKISSEHADILLNKFVMGRSE
ncbi:hypothetical protein [Endozoicomonas sp.]|uniref:hypothetical protein n=1 Tax=Endozoicomonas sp. TaxID=1892382 RepID=UPI00383ABA1D